MCYHPAAFLPPDAVSNREELASIGWIAGVTTEHPLASIDPIDDDEEYTAGIQVRQHPVVMIAEDPQLWMVADEFSTGARRSLRPEDYVELSNWHIVAVLIQSAAREREQSRHLAALGNKTQEVTA